MFAIGLFFLFLWHFVASEGRCEGNAQLSVYTQTVEQKGIRFDKLAVNRSVPVQVAFRIISTSPKIESISWAHNANPLKLEEGTGEGPEVTYEVKHQDSSFLIDLHVPIPSARVTGNWTLTARTEDDQEHKAVCFIEAPPIIRPRLGAARANEGESLSVECLLESYPLPSEIVWKRLYESKEGNKLVPVVNATFTAKDGVKNAVMSWSDATHYSGTYMCTAKSPRGSDSVLIDVRIKSKTAFIWPAVGIALEVLVLLITIVIYERHQARRRKAEATLTFDKAEK